MRLIPAAVEALALGVLIHHLERKKRSGCFSYVHRDRHVATVIDVSIGGDLESFGLGIGGVVVYTATPSRRLQIASTKEREVGREVRRNRWRVTARFRATPSRSIRHT